MSVSEPIPVAALFNASVCGRSHVGIAGSNPAGNMESLMIVMCCQVDVSASS
jgi:hypothetical protein